MPIKVMATESYGSLQQLKAMTIPDPKPGAAQVRVRVHATALNPADHKVLLGKLKFLHARNFPLVVGYDFSGTVEALGASVTDFRIGDEVFGFLPYGPGNRRGAFAEALIASTSEIAIKPAGISHLIAAAAATPGITALQSLRDLGRLKSPGGNVLITGASGGVGPLAIGIATRLGATVSAVGSGRGLEQARNMGATTVIDRRSQDVFAAAKGPYDVVFDAAAGYRWSMWKNHLKPGGRYVTTLPSATFVVDKLSSLLASSGADLIMVKSRAADLKLLGEWLAGGLQVPLDSTIPVREVASGLQRLENGKVLGRIAVEVMQGF